MSSQPVDRLHPVADFAHRLVSKLDSLASTPLWSMTAEEKRDALVTLAQGLAQGEALRLRLLAEAEQSEATVESGAGSAADWVAVETRQVRRDARSDLRLAEKLEHHDVLATGMAAGHVNAAQARAIVAALDRLPTTGEFAVSTEDREKAEAHLVALAADHDAKALRVLGRQIFEVIAPDLAEKYEGKALEAEEAAAAAAHHVHDGRGRRRHLPRTVPDPDPARSDAEQDDPRDLLTRTVGQRHLVGDRPRPADPGAARDRVHPADRVDHRLRRSRAPAAAGRPWWSR